MTRTIKHLAVLFADVCGSTQLYSELGDEQARSAINTALQTVAATLPKYSGWVVKTLGDEVMCAFEDPNLAVEAACAMQSRLEAAQPAGRGIERAGKSFRRDEIWVIGDTPKDIAAAHAAGARAVAVATGWYTIDQLRDAEADQAFPTMAEWLDTL